MLSVYGYYEHGVCVPTETLRLKEKQQVIITVIDTDKINLEIFNAGCDSLQKQTEEAGVTEQDLYDLIKKVRRTKRTSHKAEVVI